MSANADTPPTTPPAILPVEVFADKDGAAVGVEANVVVDAEEGIMEAEEDMEENIGRELVEVAKEAVKELDGDGRETEELDGNFVKVFAACEDVRDFGEVDVVLDMPFGLVDRTAEV